MSIPTQPAEDQVRDELLAAIRYHITGAKTQTPREGAAALRDLAAAYASLTMRPETSTDHSPAPAPVGGPSA
jgi:hypothetical protein